MILYILMTGTPIMEDLSISNIMKLITLQQGKVVYGEKVIAFNSIISDILSIKTADNNEIDVDNTLNNFLKKMKISVKETRQKSFLISTT